MRSWNIWTPLAVHVDAVSRHADAVGLAEPTARLMNQLGLYWLNRGQYRIAEPLMRRALHIDELSFGNDHPKVATVLNNLAQMLKATNRLAEAEPLMRRALRIDELSFGNDHPNVAIPPQQPGAAASRHKPPGRVRALDAPCPQDRRALLRNDHPNVARHLNNLAQLLQDSNRLAEAEPLMRRPCTSTSSPSETITPKSPRSSTIWRSLLQATNRVTEAEPLMRRALHIDEVSFGHDHPDVATDLNNLATLLKVTNRLAEAEPLMRRALRIDELSFGNDHPNVAIRLNNLATLLKATNRLAEAEPLMRRGLLILVECTRRIGHEHPHLDAVLSNYRGLLEALGMTPDQIRQSLRELDDSLDADDSLA